MTISINRQRIDAEVLDQPQVVRPRPSASAEGRVDKPLVTPITTAAMVCIPGLRNWTAASKGLRARHRFRASAELHRRPAQRAS